MARDITVPEEKEASPEYCRHVPLYSTYPSDQRSLQVTLLFNYTKIPKLLQLSALQGA